LVFIIAFISCKRETKAIFSEEIQEEISQYIQTHKYTAVIYVEPSQCTTCALSNLNTWKVHKKALDKNDVGILLVFRDQDENKIIEILKSLEIAFMFIFDKTGQFGTNNEMSLFEDNVFVMDKDKNVIFKGSPIISEEKWNAFSKSINN
jgi:predicted nucleic acid-binding protein